jgi:hypothetical protein
MGDISTLARQKNINRKNNILSLSSDYRIRNRCMKVHRLVVNACTEYFSGAEKEGRLLGKQKQFKKHEIKNR